MNESILLALRHQKSIDTVAAFVLDAEHDLLSVITVMQAHIDLLRTEHVGNHQPVDRLTVLSLSVTRLVQNISALAAISEQGRLGRPNQRVVLNVMLDEIAAETRSAFSGGQVSLSLNISEGTAVMGDPVFLKIMIQQLVMLSLQECNIWETVKVVAKTTKRRVSLSVSIGLEGRSGVFKRWRLGSLRLFPANGEGLGLSAVDAMARLQHGYLSTCTVANQRRGYRLTFGS